MWNCPVDPEPIDLKPWYKARVDFNIPTGGTSLYFTAQDVINKLYEQMGLGPQSKDNTNIKVKGIRAWCTAAGPSTQRPTINLDIGTVFTPVGDPATPGPAEVFYGKRKVIRDNGSLSSPARLGWKWSLADSDMPLNYNTIFSLVEVAGNLDNATLRFYIQWSITGVADPVAVMSWALYNALRLELEKPTPPPTEDDEEEEPPQLVELPPMIEVL
jgi:hypothetical protein